jgi:hypothetical protein
MLLSKLTPGAAKPLTCLEEVLPMGALAQTPTVNRLASAWFRTLSTLWCDVASSAQTHLTGVQPRKLLSSVSGVLGSWDPIVVETWIEMPGVLLRLGVCWEALLPRCPPRYRRWVAVPQSGLTAWYVCREMQTITYPTKG